MPTSATRSDAAFFSTISCAMRTRVRRRSSRSRTTLSLSLFNSRPFLASPDRVKGTDRASVAVAPDPTRNGMRYKGRHAGPRRDARGDRDPPGGGQAVQCRWRDQLRPRPASLGRNGFGGGARPRRPVQLLPLPQDDPHPRPAGAASDRVRLPGPGPRRPPRGVRLFVVWTVALAG